jgi:hypothetical protein
MALETDRDIVTIPWIKVTPNQLVAFNKYDYDGHYIKFTKRNSLLPAISGSRSHLSDLSSKKIKRSIQFLSYGSTSKTVVDESLSKLVKFRLSFFTLTLSHAQIHTDLELKSKLLNHFIVAIKRQFKVTHYVWRMEQQLNGNTHFHFLSNKFIPHYELRQLWNRIQNKLGYVDRYRESMKAYHSQGFKFNPAISKQWPREAQFMAWKAGCKSDWNQPNSTDIKSITNVKNIAAYVSKYMSKKEKVATCHIFRWSTPIGESYLPLKPSVATGAIRYLRKEVAKGRHWGCDEKLSSCKGADEVLDSDLKNELERLRNSGKCYIIDSDHYSVFCYTPEILRELKCSRILNLLLNYLIESLGVGNYYSP